MKRMVRVLALLSLILFPLLSKAAAVSFSASRTSGCDSVFSSFSPTVTGCSGGGVSYMWFYRYLGGAGGSAFTDSSTLSNYNFNRVGDWQVTVRATCGSDVATSTVTTIHVYPSPTLSFTSTASGLMCWPRTVSFTNTSLTDTSCPTSSWTWIINKPDGTSDIYYTRDVPTYTISMVGGYSVTLLYFSGCGCFGTVSVTNYITGDSFARACFTTATSVFCHPPATVAEDASCSIGAYSYLWHFGGGGTSTSATPSHILYSPGTYTDTLYAFSAAGCADTAYSTTSIFVGNLSVTMSASDDTICQHGCIDFTGVASDTTASHFFTAIDDATGLPYLTNGGNPTTFCFDTSGRFTIVDSVTDRYGCTAMTSMSIFVRTSPVITSLTADTLYRCTDTLRTTFHATTTPTSGLTYAWTFTGGLPSTSSALAPFVMYTASAGTFSPKLVVTDIHGCADTVTNTGYIKIAPVSIRITKSVDSGCIPLYVHFTIEAFLGSTPVTSFYVDTVRFSDDTTLGLGAAWYDSSHVFRDDSVQYITVRGHLGAELGGCSYTVTDSVKIGTDRPYTHLTISSDSVCPGTTVRFNLDTCIGCTYYDWSMHTPDGLDTAFGATRDTTSSYYGILEGSGVRLPGRYGWKVIISNNGCTDTLSDSITVFGPKKASLRHTGDCRVRDSITFYLSLTGATYDSLFKWYDNDSSSLTYPGVRDSLFDSTTVTSGSSVYIKSLRLRRPGWHYIHVLQIGKKSSSGCDTCFCKVNSYYDSVFIGRDTLRWSIVNPVACVGSTVTFRGPHQPDGSNYVEYYWYFGDGTTSGLITDDSVTHSYTTSDTFRVRVIVKNAYGCYDTSGYLRDTIIGPRGGFRLLTNDTLCVGDLFRFADNNISRVAGASYPIRDRNWYEGSTLLYTTTAAIDTYFNYTWYTRGAHTITLDDTDSSPGRCAVRQTKTVYTVKPYAYFYTTIASDATSTLCSGLPICFHDTNTHCKYSWNFGDVTGPGGWSTPSATAQDTCHVYATNGTFTVRCAIYADGTGIYPAGCADTAVRNNYITTGPIAISSLNFGDDDTVACPPLRIVRYADQPFNYHTWHVYEYNPTTGANIRLVTVASGALVNTTVLGTGSFRVTLIDSTPRGCKDSVSYTYFIGGPTGFISLSDTSGCAPDSIRFSFTNTSGITLSSRYIWNTCPFGSFDTTAGDITFIYSTPGTYCPPTLTIQSGSCIVLINNLTDSIRIHPVPTVTATGGGTICYLSSTTLYASGADSYVWTPSTFLNSDTIATPSVSSATTTTTYTVRGTTIYGCVDSDLVTVTVNPEIVLSVTGHDSVCIGLCDTLIASGLPGASYVWKGIGTSCAVCDTNVICITSTKTYTVTATDGAGCSDSTFFTVTINPAPILRFTPKDPYSCFQGEDDPLQIKMTGASKYVWSPRIGLSCDSCSDPVVTPPSNIIYSVTGTTQYGCKDSIIIPVVVYYKQQTEAYGDTSICRGDAAQLLAKGGVSYLWYPDNNTYDNRTSYRPIVRPIANTTYSVVVTENVCFKDTQEVTVRVVQLPVLQVPPGATIIAGNTYQLYANYGDSANHSYLTSFYWTPVDSSLTCFDCPRPIATPYVTTTYSVTASTIEGCAGTGTVTIKVLCEGSQVFIPNTFTPNGDGVNDRFYVSGKGLGVVTKMAIYNRWGEMVFDGTGLRPNDPGFGWDGTYKGEVLSPDVYVYVIEVQCTTGEPFSFRGDISIVR